MEFMSLILEKGLIIIPALNIIGVMVKGLEFVQDKYIPLILLALGVPATCFMLGGANVENIVQGILITGAAVYANNLWKQLPKTS